MRRRLPTVILAVFALAGCSRPESVELFIRSDQARDGVYVYTLPLTDTTAAYDIWFYSRTGVRPLSNLPLRVRWIAPSGDGFQEQVYMRTVDTRGTKERYRSGLIPAEAGQWQLSVRPLGVDEDFLGMGVICKKRNGSR